MKSKKNNIIAGKKIIVVGAGSTGCHIIHKFSSFNSNLTIIDRDVVEPNNLQRQFLYTSKDIGKSKAQIAALKTTKNKKIKFIFDDLDKSNIIQYIKKPDLVIDCTDNIDTRLLLNDYCAKNNINWIHTAAEGKNGQIILINNKTACYQCVFGEKHGEGCDTRGVELIVLEKIADLVINICNDLFSNKNNFKLYRLSDEKIQSFKTNKNKNCSTCNLKYNYLEGRARNIAKLCGHNRFFINLNKKIDLKLLSNRLKGEKIITKDSLITPEFTIMRKGKILIRARTRLEAREKFSKILSM